MPFLFPSEQTPLLPPVCLHTQLYTGKVDISLKTQNSDRNLKGQYKPESEHYMSDLTSGMSFTGVF